MSKSLPWLPQRLTRLDDRTRRLLTTTGGSYVGRFGAGMAVLINIPAARTHLDPELFGVWMMLTALLAFFAFADFGIGNGLLTRTTAAHATGDRRQMGALLRGGYLASAAIACVLLAAWGTWYVLASDPLSVVGRVSPSHRPEVEHTLHLFVALFVLNIPAALIQKVQLGAHDGAWAGFAQFFIAIGSVLAMPVATFIAPSLPAYLLAAFGAQVLGNLVNTVVWLRRRGYWKDIAPRQGDVDVARTLFKTGSLFFALQLAMAFAFQSDAIVITQYLGQVVYGDFAVVQRLFYFAAVILSAGLAGLWPAFGDAFARQDTAWVRRVYWRSLGIATAAATTLAVLLVLGADTLLQRWLHHATSPAWSLTLLLGIWAVIEAVGMVNGALLNGAGVLKAQVVVALLLGAVTFAAKLALTPGWGVQGSVFATIVSYCLISAPWQVVTISGLFRAWHRTESDSAGPAEAPSTPTIKA